MRGVHSTDAILESFSAFAKFCIDKNEVPSFNDDYSAKMDGFFYRMKKKYPKEFEMVWFDTNGGPQTSKTISEARSDMLKCGYLYSFSPRFNPNFISKDILKDFNRYKKVEAYMDIAEKFYNEFGCDQSGNIGKHTKFTSLEEIH
ncbi:MAG TPA: hypothetical protein PK357_02600 [Candidatus Pacearchaeota archaeon]|nr:hypothetical protein [Candidatus Pacearchaeota archaeon]